MENLRLGYSTCIAVAVLVFACSHDEPREARATARTSGDETRNGDGDRDRDRDRDERRAAAADVTPDDDAREDAPTALDQSNEEEDLAITQAIRVAVVSDDSLSFAARNVVIVTVDRVVTLRGDVNTAAERESIERHAREADGVSRVDNLLDVSP